METITREPTLPEAQPEPPALVIPTQSTSYADTVLMLCHARETLPAVLGAGRLYSPATGHVCALGHMLLLTGYTPEALTECENYPVERHYRLDSGDALTLWMTNDYAPASTRWLEVGQQLDHLIAKYAAKAEGA